MTEVKYADRHQCESVVPCRQTVFDCKSFVIAAQKIGSAQGIGAEPLRLSGARIQVEFVPTPLNFFFKFGSSGFCAGEFFIVFVSPLRLHSAEAGRPIQISRTHDIIATLPASGANLEGVMYKQERREIIPAVAETLEVLPVPVLHGQLPILGYRVGNMAYITDMKSPTHGTLELLNGVDTLVVNALRFAKEHHSHQLVHDAIDFSRAVGARKTYLTHCTHYIGTHDIANQHLPEGFAFAYDGQTISF